MANLAEGIQGLVQHMRREQQMVRDWMDSTSAQQVALQETLDRLAEVTERASVRPPARRLAEPREERLAADVSEIRREK
jgi:hypothetical protein